jgi:NAD(P)-dependent dehydrogenase (short-subunit alcohol dehydrogenase family)
MIGFTNNLAGAYCKENITCNAVAPGMVQTDMLPAFLKPENNPLGR